ncbi:MAG: SLC13/DASS family transporter [Thermoplasmata archaeon]|nr:MAG: SLC13/DASS family transporter [Thermoplasmata archaeon]
MAEGGKEDGSPLGEPDGQVRPAEFWVDIQGPSDFLYRIWINRTFRKLVPGIVIFGILLFMPTPDGLTLEGQRTLALFIFIAYLWITETFPLPVTAFMAGVGLLVLGIYTGSDRATQAFAPYASDAVFMVLGSLIMAQGLISSGGDRLIAAFLIRHFAHSTWRLLGGIVVISALISAVIPGHSVAAFMLPVVYSTIMATDMKDNRGEMAAMIIAIAMGCEVGSLATPSGGARNAIAIGYLQELPEFGRQITYMEWVTLALPLTLILIPVTFGILALVFRVGNRPLEVTAVERPENQGYRPYLGLGILGATVVMFLTLSDILSLGAVAMIGGILMFVFGLLRWDDARGEIRWGVIFIYGAALTIGKAMENVGASFWLADGLLGGLGLVTIFALIAVVVLIVASFTNLMSDAAATALFLPIVVPMAILLGAGGNESEYAFLITMATGIAAGFAYITVFGTPPNTIVHASGLVTTKDFMKAGFVLWVASVLIMLIFVSTYWKAIM